MPNHDEGRPPYRIELADEAVYAYASIPSGRVYARMGNLIDTLATFPHYGQEYDSYYPAAQPPIACRVLYCGGYGIYYHVDDELQLVTVLAIEDERRDPLGRFKRAD